MTYEIKKQPLKNLIACLLSEGFDGSGICDRRVISLLKSFGERVRFVTTSQIIDNPFYEVDGIYSEIVDFINRDIELTRYGVMKSLKDFTRIYKAYFSNDEVKKCIPGFDTHRKTIVEKDIHFLENLDIEYLFMNNESKCIEYYKCLNFEVTLSELFDPTKFTYNNNNGGHITRDRPTFFSFGFKGYMTIEDLFPFNLNVSKIPHQWMKRENNTLCIGYNDPRFSDNDFHDVVDMFWSVELMVKHSTPTLSSSIIKTLGSYSICNVKIMCEDAKEFISGYSFIYDFSVSNEVLYELYDLILKTKEDIDLNNEILEKENKEFLENNKEILKRFEYADIRGYLKQYDEFR